MAPFFRCMLTECALSSFCPRWCGDAELQKTFKLEQCNVCVKKKYIYMHVWAYVVFVRGQTGGSRCSLSVSRRQDWLVPETDRRCEDPVKTAGSSRDSWISIQAVASSARTLPGKRTSRDNIYRWVVCEPVQAPNLLGVPLAAARWSMRCSRMMKWEVITGHLASADSRIGGPQL